MRLAAIIYRAKQSIPPQNVLFDKDHEMFPHNEISVFHINTSTPI